MATILQSYQAAIAFLDTIYFRNYLNDLGSLLGDMQLIQFATSDKSPNTIDSIMWDNWILAITQVLQKTPSQHDALGDKQAFKALEHFLLIYLSTVQSIELSGLYHRLKKQDPSVLYLWDMCWHKAENNMFDQVHDSLVTLDTMVHLNQAIKIINYFTSHQLPKEQNILSGIKTLHNNKISDHYTLEILKNSYKKFALNIDENISVLKLFQVWVDFMKNLTSIVPVNNYFDIQKYNYSNTGQPKDYMIYYYWLQSIHKTLYPETIE